MVVLVSLTMALYVVTPMAAQPPARALVAEWRKNVLSAEEWRRGATELTNGLQRRLDHIESKLGRQPFTDSVLRESMQMDKLAIVTRQDIANQLNGRLDGIEARLNAIEKKLSK